MDASHHWSRSGGVRSLPMLDVLRTTTWSRAGLGGARLDPTVDGYVPSAMNLQKIITEIADEISRDATEIERSADAKDEQAAPGSFGIAVATPDAVLTAGAADVAFPIQSISKVLALNLALQRLGDRVFERVGREPSVIRSTRSSTSNGRMGCRVTRSSMPVRWLSSTCWWRADRIRTSCRISSERSWTDARSPSMMTS